MANDNNLAIDLHDVAKTYGRKVHALRGIEMQVHRGEIFGLLGPNGAGKSTLVKIMTTVVHPTRAKGDILGRHIGHKPTLRQIGYLPEHHRFPPYLTGRQVIEFYAALAKVRRSERKKRAGELLELVGMGKWANAKMASYSKGMRQRIGIAQALASNPELVILDEPTDGVDPKGRREIRELMQVLKDQGKTVFINSHLLSELEMICDRVAILVQGKVVSQGTLDDLTIESKHYEIHVSENVNEAAIRKAIDCAYDGPVIMSRPAAGPQTPNSVRKSNPVRSPSVDEELRSSRQRSFLDTFVPSASEEVEGDAPPEVRSAAPSPVDATPLEDAAPLANDAVPASSPKPMEEHKKPTSAPIPVARAMPRPPLLPHGGWFDLHGNAIHVATSEPDVIQPIIDALRVADLDIVEIRRKKQSLEDLYLEKTAGSPTGAQ